MSPGWTALVAVALAAGAAHAEDARPEDAPLALVRRAFDRSFDHPGVRSVRLRIHRGGRVVSQRSFDVAYRRDDAGGRTILRFTAPEYLRGNALLVVERPDGTNDTWLYQPEERRPRRVGTRQKADSFYGSDLSFEDMEHHRWERFELRTLPAQREADRLCHVVDAFPAADSQYGRLRIWIEQQRLAVLRIDFYRGRREQPIKRLRVDPDDVGELGAWLRVQRLRVEQLGRSAFTEVVFERIEVDPHLTERAFSALRLEREDEDLFEWIGRASREGDAR
ncbi:MAG: outer membrane lipoprotein-sorting protein [Myxococcota bacterium]|nr:outer membrane lipoprotein-sorting protein [Myxococcota bacterium]